MRNQLVRNEMHELDLCLEVLSRSCQLLRHIRHWISRKPLVIGAIGSKRHQLEMLFYLAAIGIGRLS